LPPANDASLYGSSKGSGDGTGKAGYEIEVIGNGGRFSPLLPDLPV
jgi:hypothetical protein